MRSRRTRWRRSCALLGPDRRPRSQRFHIGRLRPVRPRSERVPGSILLLCLPDDRMRGHTAPDGGPGGPRGRVPMLHRLPDGGIGPRHRDGGLSREGHHEERGERGFGYDPIFVPDGSSRTFAQMDLDEKNRFSHRGAAMRAFVERLRLMKKEV